MASSSSSSSSLRRWVSQNLFAAEPSLPKKDDDLKLPHHTADSWQAARTPRRRTLLRYAYYALGCVCVFLLVRRIAYPNDGDIVRPYSQDRYNHAATKGVPTQLTAPKATPKVVPVVKTDPSERADAAVVDAPAANDRIYKGMLKFTSLVASLRQMAVPRSSIGGGTVLFAASSLESAATVLPMACHRTSLQPKDHVLFALFGDSDVKIEEVLKVNGIDKSCKILPIDARADQRKHLSNARLALAASRAMYSLAYYARPTAVIVDGSSTEDRPFLDGIKDQLRDNPLLALIELPDRPQSRLSWISQLDSKALAKWNDVHFDIIIHAPPTGTGNIKRLLRSLAAADLAGHATPQITVELPPVLDISLERFLYNFQWPRRSFLGSSPNMLTLRHRIQHEKPSATESVVRLLESFWPKNPSTSHALILSPHTEVSPQFFHYVKYALMHHLYSRTGVEDDPYKLMFGMSFTVPEKNIQDSQSFSVPAPPAQTETPSKEGTSFVWQAPSSDAMLIFGEKWVELHGFVSQSLQLQNSGATVPAITQSKEVGQNRPAWLEHMLQLCRLRSYFTMYPSKETADAIIGVYADLPDVPDGREKSEAEARLETHAGSTFDAGSQIDMLNTLPDDGVLPSLHKVPVLSWEGTASTIDEIVQAAHKQAATFRREIGKCADPDKIVPRDPLAKDLFCAAKPVKPTE